MKELAVCVPSRGRPFNNIFKHLQTLDPKLVYIYVHGPELELYRELYPEFNIVPHNCGGIGGIRSFIQKHQHDLDNAYISFDDDTEGVCEFSTKYKTEFQMPLTKFCRIVKEQMEKGAYDFIALPVFAAEGWIAKNDPPMKEDVFRSCFVMAPGLWEKEVRFSDDMASEDWEMNILMHIHSDKVKILHLANSVLVSHEKNPGHYEKDWHYMMMAYVYSKYGRMIKLNLHLNALEGRFCPEYVNEYREAGHPVYSRLDTIQLKLWQPQTEKGKKFREEALDKIKKNKNCHAKCCISDKGGREYAENLCRAGVLQADDLEEINEEIAIYEAGHPEAETAE